MSRKAKPNSARKRRIQQRVIERDRVCHWCSAPADPPTMDHIIPASQGGNFSVANLVLACWSCNQARADRPYHYYRRYACNSITG